MYRWVIKEGLYLFMRNQKNSNPLSLLCRLINLMIKVSVVLGAVVGGNGAMAYEEAPFRILETNEIYELREYGDRLAVETSRLDKMQRSARYLTIFQVPIPEIKRLI